MELDLIKLHELCCRNDLIFTDALKQPYLHGLYENYSGIKGLCIDSLRFCTKKVFHWMLSRLSYPTSLQMCAKDTQYQDMSNERLGWF